MSPTRTVVALVRADVLVGPSPWLVDRLGDTIAGELWTKIPEALSTAISRAINVRPASQTSTDRLLANPRWPLPYEELVVYLGALDGARVITAPRSVYQLVLVCGHVIVPWCYGLSGAVSMRDVRPGRSFGRLARELLRRFGPPARSGPRPAASPAGSQSDPARPQSALPQPALPQPDLPQPALPQPARPQRARHEVPLLRDEIDEREVAQLSAAIRKAEPHARVLIAGYAGTSDHGLLRTCLGDPSLDERAALTWQHLDDLPLPPPVIPRPRRLSFP